MEKTLEEVARRVLHIGSAIGIGYYTTWQVGVLIITFGIGLCLSHQKWVRQEKCTADYKELIIRKDFDYYYERILKDKEDKTEYREFLKRKRYDEEYDSFSKKMEDEEEFRELIIRKLSDD